MGSEAPRRVAFVLADPWPSVDAMQYLQESEPYRRRVVVIELTHEQRAAIHPRLVSSRHGHERREQVLDCFIDHDPPEEAPHE